MAAKKKAVRRKSARKPEAKAGAQEKKVRAKTERIRGAKRMEREIRAVLMDLMCTAESDAVRVSAARALMDRVNKEQEDKADDGEHKEQERNAAVAEASKLLAELAVSVSKGARRKAKVA